MVSPCKLMVHIFNGFWDFDWVVFLRASLSSLSHSIDAGLGIEPSISCVDNVGVVGVDELDGEGSVVKPGTTIGT